MSPNIELRETQRALILAAGRGHRYARSGGVGLKCLADCGGTTPLRWSLERCVEAGISSAVIVVGHRAQDVVTAVRSADLPLPVTFVENPVWENSDSARSFVVGVTGSTGPLLLYYADTLVTTEVLKQLMLRPEQDAVAVDSQRPPEEWDMRATISSGRVMAMGKLLPLETVQAEATCVYHWSAGSLQRLVVAATAATAVEPGLQFERFLDSRLGEFHLHGVPVRSVDWCEVDRVSDLPQARALVAANRPEQVVNR